jgi:hypothetical protein
MVGYVYIKHFFKRRLVSRCVVSKDFVMNYRNPIYTENGWIDCEIEHPDYGWIPFTCDPDDTGALFDTAALFVEMQPHAVPYVPPPPPSVDELAAAVRAERDRLLAASDWTQLPDVPEATRTAWATYRQALRDVPEQAGFPENVVWPTKPETNT